MKIHEFRKRLKECFDLALLGKEVTIERSGINYRLTCDSVIVSSSDVTPTKESQLKVIKKELHTTKNGGEISMGFCEHYQLKGQCLHKGCKFGRFK